MADNEKRPNGRKFRFLREIASGGFGSVYLTKVSHADGFSRILAVKLLHRRWSDNAEISRRMRDEARLLGWLRHRNIVDVADLTSIDGRTAILMEYLEAADLKEIVQHNRKSGSTLPARCALEIMSAAASALDAAYNRPPYQGEKPLHVIHRDIKPSNIMVDDSGLVKVLDFGVARAEFESRESDTRELQFGSVDYMPPERLMFEPESPASDIYSLGATIFELMSGEKLGKAKGSPARHNGNIIDRLSYLRAVVALPTAEADALEEFLSSALAFEESSRPEAAQVWARCRSLSRSIGGPTIAEWAESKIPEIMKELNSRGSANSEVMIGRELSEDSFMLSTDKEANTEDPADAESVAVDDPRWSDLRNAAQAELDILDDFGQGGNTIDIEIDDIKVVDLPLAQSGDIASDDMFVGGEFEEDTRIASSDEIDILRKRYEIDSSGSKILDDMGGEADTDEDDGHLEDTLDNSAPQVITAGTLLGHAADFTKQSQDTHDDDDPFGAPLGGEATRILSADMQVELDDDGTKLMGADDLGLLGEEGTKLLGADEASLLGDDGTKLMDAGESLVSSSALDPDDGLPPPFAGAQSDLGAETILVGPSAEPFNRSSTSDLTVAAGKKRVFASFIIFSVVLAGALGGGAYIFKDQLFGGEQPQTSVATNVVEPVAPAEEDPVQAPSSVDAAATNSEDIEQDSPNSESEAPDVAPVTPQEGMVTFVSAVVPLRKMKVRCGSETQQGESSVAISLDHASAGCSVSIWPTSGSRQTARVSEPVEGVYRCFEGGEGTCER